MSTRKMISAVLRAERDGVVKKVAATAAPPVGAVILEFARPARLQNLGQSHTVKVISADRM